MSSIHHYSIFDTQSSYAYNRRSSQYLIISRFAMLLLEPLDKKSEWDNTVSEWSRCQRKTMHRRSATKYESSITEELLSFPIRPPREYYQWIY